MSERKEYTSSQFDAAAKRLLKSEYDGFERAGKTSDKPLLCQLIAKNLLVGEIDPADPDLEVIRFTATNLWVTRGETGLVYREERPSRDEAEAAVTKFLSDKYEQCPDFSMIEDGEFGWAFWINQDDTTSYVHSNLSVEWYGSNYEPSAKMTSR